MANTIDEQTLVKLEQTINKLVEAFDRNSVVNPDGSVKTEAQVKKFAQEEVDRKLLLEKERASIEGEDKYLDEKKKLLEKERDNIEKSAEIYRQVKYGDSKVGKAVSKIDKMQSKNSPAVNAVATVANFAKGVIDGLMQAVTAITDGVVAYKRSNLKESKNSFDLQQKLFQAHMEMSNVVASNMVTTMSSFATQTAMQASRSIASGALEEANARIKLVTATSMAEREFAVAEQERKLELTKAEIAASTGVADSILGIVSLFGPVGAAIGAIAGIVSGVVKAGTEIYSKLEEFDIEKSKVENEMYQQLMGNVMQVADKMKNIVQGLNDTANSIADKLMANETVYKQAGLVMGFRGEAYTKYMQKVQEQASKTFNITAEQMKQMNESYASTSGRTMIMSGDNYDQMTAISKTFGVSQGEVASMFGEMNVFNTSIESGYDMMDKMYHTATKLGLSTTKFSKDLTNNLKLAQKYNFKGGVDNMAKLTMWAEKTRFNLQNATNFADKMMSNNLSDVLETSAKLQVLGGSTSMYADPMAMMWEAGNDVGALAKRQSAMFSDITGSFNKTTGETTFSESDLRMIKARAEAIGMNYEDVLNQKRQSNKQGVINKALAKYNLSDDLLSGIGQRAVYDKKQKTFVVNTTDGQKTIDQLANMGEDAANILMPENTDAAIMDIARDTRSLVEKSEAQLAFLQAATTPELWNSIVKANEISMKSQEDMLTDSKFKEAMANSITKQADLAAKKEADTRKWIDEHMQSIDKYYAFAEKNAVREAVMGDAELVILGRLAEANGVEDISNLMGKMASVITADKGDREAKVREVGLTEDELKWFESLDGGNNTTNDGYGYTNGGYLTGANVTPINDGRGSLVKTHPNDQFLAAKSGGPIDKLFDIVYSIIGNRGGNNDGRLQIDVNGNINLRDGSGNINLVDILRNDPAVTRQFVQLLYKAMDSNKHGKISKTHNV